jgi:hypothetical protein
MKRSTSNGPTKYDRIPAQDRYKPGPGWYDHTEQSLSMTVLKKAYPLTRERQVSGFGTDSRKVFISTSCKCLLQVLLTLHLGCRHPRTGLVRGPVSLRPIRG